METPDDKGVCLRQHLEQVERSTGQAPARLLNRPHFPDIVAYVWRWFTELDSARQIGMGINPLSHTEIEAWARLNRINLTPFEVRCIRALDVVRLEQANG